MGKYCSIVYTPKSDTEETSVSYLCADNKVHIRFRDFKEDECIKGFEKKLTYLLTYLVNYAYLPSIVGSYDENTLINNFLKTSDLTSIYNVIKANERSNNFRGLKARKNYKKQDCKPFGAVDMQCFPMVYKDGVAAAGSLDTFLKAFKVSLKDYLFDDNYIIVIKSKRNNKELNNKFVNRAAKKKQRKNNEYHLTDLW